MGYVSNAGFEVEAQRRGTTGLEFRIHQTRNVTQASHKDNGSIVYAVDFSTLEGTRPSWVDASYFDSADSALGVSAVAAVGSELEGHIGDVFSENDSSYDASSTLAMKRSIWAVKPTMPQWPRPCPIHPNDDAGPTDRRGHLQACT